MQSMRLFQEDNPNYESTSFPEPRQFQIDTHEKIRHGFSNGHRCQLIMSSTGSGKTYIGLRIISEALKKGKRAIFVCDRRNLIEQTSSVADTYGLSNHGILMANHWRFNLDSPFQIASAQTLARRQWPPADVIVVDECFSGDTLIDTPTGKKKISLLSCGELVYNACGESQIISVFSKIVYVTLKIRMSNGTIIECTADHPVFTDMGWKPASALGIGTRLFCREAVRALWQGFSPYESEGLQRENNLRGGGVIHREKVLRDVLREEIKKPNAPIGDTRKGIGKPDKNWSQTPYARREWNWSDGSSVKNDELLRSGLEGGICSEDTQEQFPGIPSSLQNRYCEQNIENSDRDRRPQSLLFVEESAGHEERRSFEKPWVESVEIIKSDIGVNVYNLRVADHPSYFANGFLVHNCHVQMKVWTDHIQKTSAAVIGLSATPFSSGLGKLFSNLVCALPMHDLVQSGVLVPMRILSCTKANMDGAATAGGEWTDSAAAERGMDIVGDVVTEWIKFGENRKTIVFGATIAHCEELCKQFNECGVLSMVFCADTPDDERKSILTEYKKPDSAIRVLLSVEALSKGMDQKDVGCIVDCRPLRKSLSSFVQMVGRGLRSSPETGKKDCILLDHCIASGQLVLTRRGLIPIELILISDKIWDGEHYVSHKGVVSRGKKHVISYAGLTATADHPVKTSRGWRTLGDCAEKQTPIITTGFGGKEIRISSNYFTSGYLAWAKNPKIYACIGRVRGLWLSCNRFAQQFNWWKNSWLSCLQSTEAIPELALSTSKRDACSMQQSKKFEVHGLWRERNRVPFRERDSRMHLDTRQPWFAGKSKGNGVRQDKQQRELRAGEYPMVNKTDEYEQYSKLKVESIDPQIQDRASMHSICRLYYSAISFVRSWFSRNCKSLEYTVEETEREVWDILDCGPSNSFTCQGLLVHNSGNILRFKEDFEDIFFNGLSELDNGEKLDKAIRKDKDPKEATGCPKCHRIPFNKRCMACGFELAVQSLVGHTAGQMQEIVIGKKKLANNELHLYQQHVTYARSHGNADTQKQRAAHMFKRVTGKWPSRSWNFDNIPNVTITQPVLNKIRADIIAYSKAVKR